MAERTALPTPQGWEAMSRCAKCDNMKDIPAASKNVTTDTQPREPPRPVAQAEVLTPRALGPWCHQACDSTALQTTAPSVSPHPSVSTPQLSVKYARALKSARFNGLRLRLSLCTPCPIPSPHPLSPALLPLPSPMAHEARGT